MPKCKNDPTSSYVGLEPSPKGFGYCAHAELIGTIRKGKDNEWWIVSSSQNGTKRWVKYNPNNKTKSKIKFGLNKTTKTGNKTIKRKPKSPQIKSTRKVNFYFSADSESDGNNDNEDGSPSLKDKKLKKLKK